MLHDPRQAIARILSDRHHRTPRMVPLAILLVWGIALCPPGLAQYGPPVGDTDYDESNAFVFLRDEVTYIDVTMDPADLQAILNDPHSNDYKVCSIRFHNSATDEIVANVGIRPRGNYSRRWKKFNWKLDFNVLVPGRKFHGLEEFNVNADSPDPSISRSMIALDMHRAMGVPAARSHHVYLTINDGTQVEGVYVQVEQVDDEFVQAWFGNKTGDLYKCRQPTMNFVADLRYIAPGLPETYRDYANGEVYQEQINNADFIAFAAFVDFVNNTDLATFAAGIGDYLNVDGFLRAMAVDAIVGNWDGYWLNANNYYLYQNLDAGGRFEFIPWDLENSFGMNFFDYPLPGVTNWVTRDYDGWGDGGGGSSGGSLPPLIDRLLQVPEYNNALLRYVREAIEGPAGLAAHTDNVDKIQALLAPLAFMGSWGGSNNDFGYTNYSTLVSFDYPATFDSEHRPATWGLRSFIRWRAIYVRDYYPLSTRHARLFVNEVVADNETVLQDEAGEFEDYVEIYNDESFTVDLSGMYLSDYAGDPRAWAFPPGTTIPSKGFVLVWCDEDVGQGPLHTTFKLSKAGEGVWLFDDDADFNQLLDDFPFPALSDDEAFGRFPDGCGVAAVLNAPSPEATNAGSSAGFVLTLDGACPGRVDVYASGATPGEWVAFIAANGPGSFVIPSGPWAGTVLGLDGTARLYKTKSADVNGTARISGVLPESLCGLIWLQALDLNNGATSNVLNF